MGSVDDRVVAMKFDNKDFEQKVSGTLSILEKLKGALNFGTATKGMQDLSAASKNFSMEGMATSIDSIASKFTAMGAVGFSVINNLVTTALGAASRLAKEFTFGPVSAGFQEFELNMGSIQTILANTESKGTVLKDVTNALDQLNEYSDKTIYNFGQMAKNVGTFTAAGVDLQTSVNSIKGISNLAAISGSSADQASTAMYQLSQAISNGKVQLIDWISVNNASMGGEVFQKALFETGKALGTIKNANLDTTFEEWEKSGGKFREQLEKGWVTSKVLTTTLQGFTGDLNKEQLIGLGYTEKQADQFVKLGKNGLDAATNIKTFTQLMGSLKEGVGSGWSETFRMVIGDFEQGKELFSGLYRIFSGLAERMAFSRNATLQFWKDFGGRDALVQSLRNILTSLGLVLLTIQKAFRAAFPKKTGEQLISMTQTFEKFTNALIPGENTLKIIGGVLGSVFSVLSIGWTVVKEATKAFLSLFQVFKVFGAAGDGPANFIGGIGDKIASLRKLLVDDGGIAKFFENISKAITDFVGGADLQGKFATITEGLGKFKDSIANFFGGLDIAGKFDSIIISLTEFKDAVVAFFRDEVGPALQPAIDAFNKLKDVLTQFFSAGFANTVELLGNAFNKFKEIITGLFDKGSNVSDGMTSIADSTGRVGDRFESLSHIGEKVGAVFDWLREKFTQVIAWLKDFIPKITEAMSHGDFNSVLDVLNIGLFAAILLMIKQFTSSITGLFDGVKGVLSSFQTAIKADALMKIAKALALLTASLVVLSLIDSADLTKSMVAMGVGIQILVKALEKLDKIGASKGSNIFTQDGKGGWKEEISGPGRLDLLALGLIAIAAAMLVLSFAVKNLASVPTEDLVKGMSAITILIGEMALAVKLMDSPERMISTGLGMYAIAKSLQKLVDVVVAFGTLPYEVLKQGLAAVSLALGVIGLTVAAMPDDSDAKGLGLGLIAVGLLLISKAVTDLGNLNMDQLAKGLGSVVIVLLAIAGAVRLTGDPKRMLEIGAGIALIAVGLVIMSKALENLGRMDADDLVKSVLAISSVLLSLAAATTLMKGNMDGAKTIAILTVTLLGLAAVIKIFDAIGFGNAMIALGAILITLGAIAIVAGILAYTGATAAILALGFALKALGLGFVTFALAALLFAAAVFIIAFAIKTIVEVGDQGVNRFIELLPKLSSAIVSAVVGAIKQFLEASPELVKAFGVLLDSLINLINETIPKIANTFGILISEIKLWMDAHWQEIVDIGWKLLDGILTGIDDNIAEVTARVMSICQQFFDELNKDDGEAIRKLIDGGFQAFMHILDGFISNMAPVSEKLLVLAEEFKKQIIDKKVAEKISEAGVLFLGQFLTGIGKGIIQLSTVIGTLMVSFMQEMGKNVRPIANAAFKLLIDFLTGLSEAIDNNEKPIREAGKKLALSIVKAVANGILDFAFLPIDAMQIIGNAIIEKVKEVFKINSPSKVMYDIASGVGEGLAKGFNENTQAVNSAERFANEVVDKLNQTFDQTADAMLGMREFNPTITPILDLANIEQGAKKLGSLMDTPKIDADVSYRQAASLAVATRQQQEDNAEPLAPVEIVKEVNYTQINNSPEALSTKDIYRNTKSQIALAKKELVDS